MVTVNNRERLEWHDGMTVSDILETLRYTYTLITVTVNGEVVRQEEYADFPIPDQAEVGVFHLAHGG